MRIFVIFQAIQAGEAAILIILQTYLSNVLYS